MRIRIVSYEEVGSWILGKFALKMLENLQALSIEADIGREPDPSADINHHIMNWGYSGVPNKADTLMITHAETLGKIKLMKEQLQTARMGICMSAETVAKLTASGLPANKLTYVNPAHDEAIKPRKYVVGITSRTYPDGRKKEGDLVRIAESLSSDYFEFRIMGAGWEAQVERIRALGFEVTYFESFDRLKYMDLMRSFDYYLYFSWDEGSMGYLDALCAGVETVVTPQGFHLDAIGGLTHPIKDIKDVAAALNRQAEARIKRVQSIANWTWRNYTLKHIGIWKHILGEGPLPNPSFDDVTIALERQSRTKLFLGYLGNHLRFRINERRKRGRND